MSGFETYQVVFNLKIEPHLIPLFKKEILHLAKPWENQWHNHAHEKDDVSAIKAGKIIYGRNIERYPSIQFRTEAENTGSGKIYRACIWSINEGVKLLRELELSGALNNFSWKGRTFKLKPREDFNGEQILHFPALKILPKYQLREYSLMRILPFDRKAFNLYKKTEFFSDKLRLLEDQVKNQVILFARSYHQEKVNESNLVLRILDISKFEPSYYQPKEEQVERLSYLGVDLLVGMNVELPEGIGLGKHKALGYGVLRRRKPQRSLKD